MDLCQVSFAIKKSGRQGRLRYLVSFINCYSEHIMRELEMWASAQRDGRPAEHRWRALFNVAKFGWRPLLNAVQ